MNYRLDIYAPGNRLAAVRCFTASSGKAADTEARRIVSAWCTDCITADNGGSVDPGVAWHRRQQTVVDDSRVDDVTVTAAVERVDDLDGVAGPAIVYLSAEGSLSPAATRQYAMRLLALADIAESDRANAAH